MDYLELKAIKTQQKTQEEPFPLPYLPIEFRYGPGLERELLAEITLSERLICMAGQTPVYQTSLLYLTVGCPPPTLKHQAPFPFLSSGWHLSLNCLTALGSDIFMGLPYI